MSETMRRWTVRLRGLLTLAVLLMGWAPDGAQAQLCTVQVNGANSTVIQSVYRPADAIPATLSVSCPPDTNDHLLYSVRLLSTGTPTGQLLGPQVMEYFVAAPSSGGCSSTPLMAGDYEHPVTFAPGSGPHTWSVPFCIRITTALERPAHGEYEATFSLQIARCRVRKNNCVNTDLLLPAALVTLKITVPASCTVAHVQSLNLSYRSGQPEAAVALGEACVVCNPNFMPSSIRLTPEAAVQLGLRYTVTGQHAVSTSPGCAGIRVQYQAEIPGQQWGRCSSAQCTSTALHQIVVEH